MTKQKQISQLAENSRQTELWKYFKPFIFMAIFSASLHMQSLILFASFNKLVINLFRTASCYAVNAVHNKIEFMIILIIGEEIF